MFQNALHLIATPVWFVLDHPFMSIVAVVLTVGLWNSGAIDRLLMGIGDFCRWLSALAKACWAWLLSFNRDRKAFIVAYQAVHPTTDDDITRISWRSVTQIGIILTCFVAAGVLIARTIPVHRVETSERRVVTKNVTQNVRREHVVQVPVRGYAPLKDWRDGCTNAPVVIKAVTQTGEKDGERRTWFTAQPAGDPFTIACVREGHYASDFPVGALAIIGGQPDDQTKPAQPDEVTLSNGAKVRVKDDGAIVVIGDREGSITSDGASFGGVSVSQGTTE